MKAIFVNDTATGPGHGFLRITETGPLAASEDIRFCIKRASDRHCLGAAGWQPADIFLAPEALSQEGDSFSLNVGPSVVDNLDSQEAYRITLQGGDGSQGTATLRVDEVIYSPVSGGQGIGAVAHTPVQPQPTPPKPEPVAEIPHPVSVQPDPAQVQQPVVEPQKPTQLPNEDDADSESKTGLIITCLILLLVLGAFAAWKWFDTDEPVEEAPLAQARKHFQGEADPVVGMKMAESFRAHPNGADAAFLLAEDAAQKGNAEGMLMTGDFYSPADSGPSGSIQKDALQAFYWYTKAKEAGAAGADARLGALRSWAEAEAAKGLDEAASVLEKFKAAL